MTYQDHIMNGKRKYALAVLDMLSANIENEVYFKDEDMQTAVETEIESIRRILRATIEREERKEA